MIEMWLHGWNNFFFLHKILRKDYRVIAKRGKDAQ